MLIEDLEVFVAAAESDSFITPVGPHRYETSASKEILRLEKEFGTPLFLREGKNTGVLTEAGEALLLKAKPLIHSYRRTMRTMEQFRPKNDRSVIIGALPILKQYRLNRVFSRFMDDFEVIKGRDEAVFGDKWRVFGRYSDLPASQLPRDTSLRAAYADRLASGLPTGEGFGVFAFDGEKII